MSYVYGMNSNLGPTITDLEPNIRLAKSKNSIKTRELFLSDFFFLCIKKKWLGGGGVWPIRVFSNFLIFFNWQEP